MQTHLTEEHIRKLRETLQGHPLEVILTLALVTGMRRDELLHLQWQDIDLEKGELRVLNSKTQSGRQLIRVSQELTEMLKQHRTRRVQARLQADTAEPPLDLVFPDTAGGFLTPAHLLKGWYEILEQAELPLIRFHDLRHVHRRTLREQVRTASKDPEDTETGLP